MIPNARNLKTDPMEFAILRDQIGKPQHWVATRSGISKRRIQYLAAGERLSGEVMVPVRMSYPEQFVLECLAEAAVNLE
jgi:hypothetical protein